MRQVGEKTILTWYHGQKYNNTQKTGRKPTNLATLWSAHFGREDVRGYAIGWKHPAWLAERPVNQSLPQPMMALVTPAVKWVSKRSKIQMDGSSNAKGLFHQRSCLQIHMKRFVIRQMWKRTFEAFESVDMKCKYETEDLNLCIWNTNMKY